MGVRRERDRPDPQGAPAPKEPLGVEEVDHDFGCGYLCSLFRNEGAGLSSEMIESAIALTELRWGTHPEGWLTFVREDEVASPNPGYCFKCAGFVPVGYTRERHYLALRRYTRAAAALPAPAAVEA
jgi:hypothetical protein